MHTHDSHIMPPPYPSVPPSLSSLLARAAEFLLLRMQDDKSELALQEPWTWR